jgi:hypothetical protein
MSQANAAAIKRRVNAPQVQQNGRPGQGTSQGTGQSQLAQAQQSQGTGQGTSQGLTLQQVISVIDKRLILVESGLKEVQGNKTQTGVFQPQTESIDNDAFSSIVDEFNERFELLAVEINTLKDLMLKLQSFTMDVNKTLMEERINILSDLGNVGENDSVTNVNSIELQISDENNEHGELLLISQEQEE